jgi:hypothetical protein
VTDVERVGVPRAESGPERRRVRHGGTIDIGVKYVGHHLQDLSVDRCPSRGVNGVDVDVHPARVQRHGHHLGFDDAADVPGGVVGRQSISVDPRIQHRRRDLGFEPGDQDAAFVARARGLEQPREFGPAQAERIAYSFARERPVAETRQPHVVARGRAEDVSRAGWIDARLRHEAEDGVARTERDPDAPLAHEPHADQTAGIVARPGDDLRRRQSKPLLPVA